MRKGKRTGAYRRLQFDGDVVGGEFIAARVDARYERQARRYGACALALLDPAHQRSDGSIGGRLEHQVDGWQSLVIHAPAVVQAMIERHVNDLCGRFTIACSLQRARQIDPVERQNDVCRGDSLGCGRHQHHCRRVDVERMLGRERGADFQIGHHAGAEQFRQRQSSIPVRHRARHATHQDQWRLRGVEHFRGRFQLRRIDTVCNAGAIA